MTKSNDGILSMTVGSLTVVDVEAINHTTNDKGNCKNDFCRSWIVVAERMN
jgi:hypothetical protein